MLGDIDNGEEGGRSQDNGAHYQQLKSIKTDGEYKKELEFHTRKGSNEGGKR